VRAIPVYILGFLDQIGCNLSPKSIEKKVEKVGKDIVKGAKKAGEAIEEKAEEIGHDIKKGSKKRRMNSSMRARFSFSGRGYSLSD